MEKLDIIYDNNIIIVIEIRHVLQRHLSLQIILKLSLPKKKNKYPTFASLSFVRLFQFSSFTHQALPSPFRHQAFPLTATGTSFPPPGTSFLQLVATLPHPAAVHFLLQPPHSLIQWRFISATRRHASPATALHRHLLPFVAIHRTACSPNRQPILALSASHCPNLTSSPNSHRTSSRRKKERLERNSYLKTKKEEKEVFGGDCHNSYRPPEELQPREQVKGGDRRT